MIPQPSIIPLSYRAEANEPRGGQLVRPGYLRSHQATPKTRRPRHGSAESCTPGRQGYCDLSTMLIAVQSGPLLTGIFPDWVIFTDWATTVSASL